MSSALSIASSGMNAAQVNLSASAHNIANLSTEPFRREQVMQATAANGGVVMRDILAADAIPIDAIVLDLLMPGEPARPWLFTPRRSEFR